jgi:hypothetical protein
MQKPVLSFCFIIFLAIGSLAQAQSEVTPSHVYQASQELIAEIELLRSKLTIRDYPPNPEPQEDRSPIHAYAKSLEVLLKLIWIEQKYGIAPSPLGQIPVKAVISKDVLEVVNILLDEVRRIKAELRIKSKADKPPYREGKEPSDVYNNLSVASSLLDGVVGRSLSFNDVYRNTEYVIDEMSFIANKLGVTLDHKPPVAKRRKLPKDIAQQVYLAVNRIIDLQENLKMNASNVPRLTMVRITPSEVYDATSVLLAELVRIKHYLKIETPYRVRSLPFAKRPADVFANMRLTNKNLHTLNTKVVRSWR